MEADDEEGLAAEAQREMRVLRIGAHRRIIILAAPHILVRQRLDPLPQRGFELGFRQILGPLEHHGEAAEQGRGLAIGGGEGHQPVMDAQIVPRAVDPVAGEHLQRAARKRGLGADTGEGRCIDHRMHHRLQFVLRVVLPGVEWGGGHSHQADKTHIRSGRSGDSY